MYLVDANTSRSPTNRAGVIGLSTALRLQEEEPDATVTVIARDLPGPTESIDPVGQINYSSPWAGAHNRWVPPEAGVTDETARDHRFALETYAHMAGLEGAEAGVRFVEGIEYVDRPGPAYAGLTAERAAALGMDGFRRLAPGELPAGAEWGCAYRTWCVNPMVYCCFLLRRFARRGGRVVRREVRCPAEVFALAALLGGPVDVVVNCSGNGFGDPDVFVTRGQTCLVADECDATVTRQHADGTWTFSVPRGFDGGTIIGGTKEVDNWDPDPSVAVREELLRKFAETYPKMLAGGSGTYTVMRDIVGRRPTRKGGIRLEAESFGDGKLIVHAYGLGGRGYELSWGVAGAAVGIVKSHKA